MLFRDGESVAEQLGVITERIAGERGRRLLTLGGSTVRGVVYGILHDCGRTWCGDAGIVDILFVGGADRSATDLGACGAMALS